MPTKVLGSRAVSCFGSRLWLLLFLAIAVAGDARAAIQLWTVVSGFTNPLYLSSAGDGSSRLYVVEQAGRIRIFSDGVLLPVPFLDITDRVRAGGETGLLGLAFHPNYASNGRFFLNYTRNSAGPLETVIAEYSVSPGNPNLADRNSETILLRFNQPFSNHNGGTLQFGPDGTLYIATGDGGSGGDPQGNGQNLETLLGKILRLDVDSGSPAIPADNPFVGVPGRDEIWAYGLRNPWRFSFDRLTGRLFVGDVGQSRREEVDIVTKGGNYGWNIMEGTLCFSPLNNCDMGGLLLPIHDYARSLGTSITGGYVYRGPSAPSLWGKYIFADFGSGRLWALEETSPGQWERQELLSTGLPVSSFGEGENGELYLVDYSGSVLRIVESNPAANVVDGVASAASFQAGAVAPGQIVSIFGSSLGPAEAIGAALDAAGRVATERAGVRVLFDGIAAPLFFVHADQINAQVPYFVAGKSGVEMTVISNGTSSSLVNLAVEQSAPAIFARARGTGQGAILNRDGSLNSALRPAPRGSVIVIYATGEGERTPPGVDGELSRFPFSVPALPVSLTIGGLPAAIEFAGAAPRLAGVVQINARVPLGVAPGNSVPVTLTVGGASSPPGITLAVN